MKLSPTTAAALAAAIFAAAAVLLFSRLPDLFVWAAFIGWASYDHSGANPPAALKSSTGMLFGVVMAWCVAVIVASGLLGSNTLTATAVSAGVASFTIVAASRLSILSVVPAMFYGFASTFAYLSFVPAASTFEAMTTIGWHNAIVVIPLSLFIGTGLGAAHGLCAKVLASSDVCERHTEPSPGGI